MVSRPSWRPRRRHGRHAADRPPAPPREANEARPSRPLARRSADAPRRGDRRTVGINARRNALDALVGALQRASDLRGVLVYGDDGHPRVVVSLVGRATNVALSVRAEYLRGGWCFVWAADGGGGPRGDGEPGPIGPVDELAEALDMFREELRGLAS